MISCHNSHLYIWKRFSFTHTRSKHPSFKTEWVTLLFTIFQIPSQVFGLAGCSTFSLAITGLLGFSNGPFEETTLLSQANGGGGTGDGDIWPAINPTGWAQTPSDAFGDEKVPKTCGSGERDAHTHFFSGFGLQFHLLLWNMSTTFSSVLKLKLKFQFLHDFFLLPLIQTSTHWHYKRIITGSS